MKILSRPLSLSLRAKLTILLECCILLLVVVTTILVTLHEREILKAELHKRGLSLASDLANFATRPLVNNDLATLRRFVNNVMEKEHVLYALILDPDGRVVMHNDLSEVHKIYRDPISLAAMNSEKPWHNDIQEANGKQNYSDIFAPIAVSSLRIGTVRLGYSHLGIQRQLVQSGQQIVLIGLCISIAGAFIAYLLATYISSPIRQITVATEEVSRGNLNTALSIRRNDEIGTLADAFNRMTSDLKQSTVSREYVDNIIGSMNDTLIVVDPNARISSANRAACRLLEYQEHELVGKDIRLILTKEEAFFRRPGFLKKLEEAAITNYEMGYRTKNGKSIPVLFSASLLKNKEGTVEGLVGIARDITEQKLVTAALRVSEENYRTLFENSKDVVYISTPEGKFIDINPAGVELFGYPTEEDLLQIDIVHDLYDSPEKREIFQQMITKEGFVKDFEVVFRRKDGGKVIVLLTASSVRSEEGEIIAYQGIMKDITEWKRLEQQLLHAQKMEAIGTLAGGIAHDFNNILTVIIGYGSLLQQRNQDETLRPYITLISDAAQNAANLTRSLLTFSRRQIINPKPVNLNKIVQGVVKILSRIIREDIGLSLALTDKDTMIMADTGQIEQVMMNLATNARDAMPDGGKLTIRTDLVRLDSEFIKTHGFGKAGAYAVIIVQDTGHGMEEEARERLFEPFYTTKEPGMGTGLGLSMVYGIIRQHEGDIQVQSEPGIGTTFTIYLPLIKSEEEGGAPEAPLLIKGGTETVLLVEDNNDVRNLVKETLQRFGYSVIEAEDGEDAIRVFHENKDRIQLLVLDVIMPKKNGKEVHAEIQRFNPSIKTIFMSGHDARIIHEKGVFQEGLHFLSKPVLPDELLRKIREVFDDTGASKEYRAT